MFHGDHWMWGGHGGWWILLLLFLIALFWSIGRSSRRTGGERAEGASSTPLEELKRRYAAGEISTEEFEERRQTLEDS